MSGGVDSSVAAALLVDQGNDVEGVTLRLWSERPSAGEQSLAAAWAVCAVLGIRHRTLDLTQAFYTDVVGYFEREYAWGRTPNPCMHCNRLVKFGVLLDRARQLGFDLLATGHYARIECRGERYRLLTGIDRRKDQSYFLYMLQQGQLASLCFPLGELTKVQVRGLAARRGLPVTKRPESQDVCFIPDGDYRRFITRRHPDAVRAGPIYDAGGRLLGEHRGLPLFTVGQRSGLGLSAERPLYVLWLDPARNAVIVGHAEELGSAALHAEETSYVSGEVPAPGRAVEAKIRYRARRQAGRLWPQGPNRALVTFVRPLRDITPGQSVVLYDGENVLGGGVIADTVES